MNRGDVVLFDYPFSDRTGSKLRPALVVQSDLFNRSIDDTVLAIITRTRRSSPAEVLVDLSMQDTKQSGLHHSSVVDCKNLLTVDKRFIHARLGKLPSRIMAEVDSGLKTALAIP